jgi:hypothetical protein
MPLSKYLSPTAVLVFISSFLYGQDIYTSTTFKGTSLDLVTDVASIGMGESFVANAGGSFAYFENPAALPTDEGTHLFYNYRSQNWAKIVENSRFESAGMSWRFNWGILGFGYSQYSSGTVTISDLGETMEDQNRTFILAYSLGILDGLHIGANVKLFNRSVSATGLDYHLKSNNSILFDAGALYETGLFSHEKIKNKLSLGVSLQNFGTDYKEEITGLSGENDRRYLPRYLRAGFCYEMNLIVGEKTRTNVDLLFTGEYRNLLNPGSAEMEDTDYWGFGIEATLFKIISLRLGGVSSPEYNVLFDRTKLNLRYGIGMNFPIAMVGLNYPLIIKFDFASIPINQTSFEGAKSSLYGFGVSLIYTKPM